MARAAPGGAGGFLGGAAQNVAANLLGAVLGALCVSFGLAQEASLAGLQSWPAWVALTGALLTASIAANLAYPGARHARRWAIGRAKAAQPSILIAKIEGDG